MRATDLDRLNAAQAGFDNFGSDPSAAARVCRELAAARPRGYIARHSSGECRVMLGDTCLTPLSAIPEQQAVELATEHRIQTEIRFSLGDRRWFDSTQ